MCRKGIEILLVVVMVTCVPAFGAARDSADFIGTSYEGDAVPTAASVPWDLGFTGPIVDGVAQYDEAAFASSDGSVLNIDTDYAGAVNGNRVAWYLPGEEAGDISSQTQHWPGPGEAGAENNPWNPNFDLGYTVETRIRINNTNSESVGFSMYFTEGTTSHPYGGIAYLIDFFDDSISSGLFKANVFYEGDMSDAFHTVRVVRNAGRLDYLTEDYPVLDVYVDGVLMLTGIYPDGNYMNTGGASLGSPEDFLWMGTAVGMGGENVYDVDIDYIRCDFTGAYTPEPATMILLGLGSLLLRRKH